MRLEIDLRLLCFSGVADLLEGSFDEVFPLFTDAVIDRGHGLNGACCRTSEGELAIRDFALVEGKCAVSENDKTAVGEGAAFVFMEIEYDFFVSKCVFGDFHKGLFR